MLFGYLGSLEIPYECYGGFSISAKNIVEIFVRVALTLKVALGIVAILTVSSAPLLPAV